MLPRPVIDFDPGRGRFIHRREDVALCLGGDSRACDRVYFTFYVWPRLGRMLQEILEKMRLFPPIVPPTPGPDPSPYAGDRNPQPNLDWELLIPLLLAPYLGDPHPQPSLLAKSRLEVLVTVQNALKDLVTDLDKEIEALSKQG